jgi:putative peptidoglycan lipid II flippase
VSALRFGDDILRLPGDTLGVAWTTVIYPTLVRAAQPGAARTLADETAANLRYMACVYIPLAVATAAMAPLIIDVVYRRGAFDASAAATTSGVLAALAPLLVLAMANAILASAHNARRNGGLLLAVGILNVIVNLILNILLGLPLGVAGVALSSSVTMTTVVAILAWRLSGDEAGLRIRPVLAVSIKALVASLVPGVPIAIFVWTRSWSGEFLLESGVLVMLAIGGAATYLIVARSIGLTEPSTVIHALAPSPRWRR